MAESSFKLSRPLEERIRVCARLRKKHNGKIPLLLVKAEHSDVPDIDKNRKLVSTDVTIGQVAEKLRKVTNFAAEKSIFVFVKNTLCPSDASIAAIYEEHNHVSGRSLIYSAPRSRKIVFAISRTVFIVNNKSSPL